uniref:BSD domain-containing protein n=2 Tax=Clastoptera arizonana TaxID=38151 RepID=A0A1B6D7E9_9HEMI
MTEAEFWTKFFQSHYFHRDRIHAGTKDLFTECAKMDDQELKKTLAAGVSDPLVDLTSFEDNSIDDGLIDKQSSTNNIVHQSMIKRFNQHSIMVLKACKNNDSIKAVEGKANGSVVNGDVPGTSHDVEDYVKTKKMKIQQKINYDDLNANSDLNSHAPSALTLTKVDRYLHGPTPSQSDFRPNTEPTQNAWAKMRKEASCWTNYNHSTVPLVTPAAAVSALGELTPGGALMKCFHEESLAQLVPPPLEKELRNLYMSGCELLRHFWLCFPTTTPELQEKAERMHEALHRFHSAKLKPFEDRVMLEFSPLSQQLTSHMNQLLTTAYSKFEMWQSRRKPPSLR